MKHPRRPIRSNDGSVIYMKVYRGDGNIQFPYIFMNAETAPNHTLAYVRLTDKETEAIKTATDDGLLSMWLCIASFQQDRIIYIGNKKNATRKK